METGTSGSLEGRKGRLSEKSGAAKVQSTVDSSTLKEKALLHHHDKLPPGPITAKEATGNEMEGSHLAEGGGMLATIIERQEPTAVTVSPPSSAADDSWDFLSDSPQEVARETIDQQV